MGSRRGASPVFEDRSVFEGLERRAVTVTDLVAHSIAVVCPSVSALGMGFALPHTVGPGAWLSLVIGFGVALLLALVFGEFGSRLRAAGSLYTYVAKGLGPMAALVVGVSLILGYAALIGFGLVAASLRGSESWRAFTGVQPTLHLELVIVGLGLIACLLIMRRGVKASTRVALVAESAALGVLVLILVLTVSRSGLPGFEFFSLEGADPRAILTGAASISLVVVGFESSSALGVETDRPFFAVPRAMTFTIVLTGFLFGLASVVSASTVRGGRGRFRWWEPGSEISPLDGFSLLILAISFVALSLCAWTALSRLVFSFAREGVLPSWLGKVGNRFGNPDRAALVLLPMAVLPLVLAWATGERPGHASREMLSAATIILFVAYGVTSVALIAFLWRIDELTVRPVVMAVLAAAGVALMAVVDVHDDLERDRVVAVILLVGVVMVGLLWWIGLRLRRPASELRRRIGSHDAALASDVVLGSVGPIRRE